MRTLRLAAALFFALPAAAWASAGNQATIRSQDLPIGVTRTTAAAAAPARFNLVAFHWQGTGTVSFRTHSLGGRWSSWHAAAPEAEDVPDPGSAESRPGRGWHLGNPYWVGSSDRIAYRLNGDVRRLRAWYVWSPVGHSEVRTVAQAGTPRILPRSAWGANDRILRGAPRYAKTVQFAVVHHTAGTNAYGPAASAAIVRGIELYHVKGNGWNDIGYNFLVDKYGQVFEGRAGGVERNVVGAQAEGFNTGSVGVAVIGNYSSAKLSPAAQRALVDLLAWRLDVAHVDPLGFITWTSGGNPKYPRGTPVLLRAVSGHRDTGFTSCPGTSLYAKLPDIARQVAATGLPKLYAPSARGTLGGRVRFAARLSAAAAWTVTVRDAGGAVVARGRGTGQDVSWSWDSSSAAPGRYTWTIEGDPDTRPASGVIGKAPPPVPPSPSPPPSASPQPASTSLLTDLAVDPMVISPDGDGIADSLTISYTLAARSSVTAVVRNSDGAAVATLFTNQKQGNRHQSFPYAAPGLPDDVYTLMISAVAEDGRTGTAEASFAIDRTLSGLALGAPSLSPNGDGADDTLGISFTLAAAVTATVQIEQAGAVVATLFAGPLPAGPAQATWDGNTPAGPAPAGAYDVAVIVNGPYGQTRHAASFSLVR